jgi:hypothetical protein
VQERRRVIDVKLRHAFAPGLNQALTLNREILA